MVFVVLVMFVAGLLLGFVLYLTRFTILAGYTGLFFATILAFLISDFLSKFVMRGGRGIVQVPSMKGTQTVTKTMAFLALLVFVPIVGIIVGLFSDMLTTLLESQSFGIMPDLGVGLVLSCLVYADLELKFYGR